MGDHGSRSDRFIWGIHLVAGLGSHWARVRADFLSPATPSSLFTVPLPPTRSPLTERGAMCLAFQAGSPGVSPGSPSQSRDPPPRVGRAVPREPLLNPDVRTPPGIRTKTRSEGSGSFWKASVAT